MLNHATEQRILSVLGASVLSTSMIARKTKLSRITVTKYLNTMESSGSVKATRIGKALAWKQAENKPVVAIIAKTGTARIVQLALGNKFRGVLATNPSQVPNAFLVITDQPRIAKASSDDVILIGATEENAFCIPELFEISELGALINKLYLEQLSFDIPAAACISIEHVESAEDVFGFQGAESLLDITMNLLREHNIPFTQMERTYFVIEGPVPEAVLNDIEQMFHTVLAHLYGEMVTPGEELTYDGVEHTVPCLTITLTSPIEIRGTVR